MHCQFKCWTVVAK